MPLPLPDELAAVNVYAVERPDGLTLIDAGQALRAVAPAWRRRWQRSATRCRMSASSWSPMPIVTTTRSRRRCAASSARTVRLGIHEAPSLLAVGRADWQAFASQLAELRRCGADSLADEIAAEAAGQGMESSLWEPPDEWVLDDDRHRGRSATAPRHPHTRSHAGTPRLPRRRRRTPLRRRPRAAPHHALDRAGAGDRTLAAGRLPRIAAEGTSAAGHDAAAGARARRRVHA